MTHKILLKNINSLISEWKNTLDQDNYLTPRECLNQLKYELDKYMKSEREDLSKALENIITPEQINEWLDKPNPIFDNKTPMDLVREGDSARLYNMIYDLQPQNIKNF